MAKKSFKKEQYSQTLVNELNTFLRTGANDSRLTFVSVTKVELSVDYSIATVYWDTFDASKRGDAASAMSACASKLRGHLAKVLKVRHTPQIVVKYDSQFEDENAITELLDNEASLGKKASEESDEEE